MGEGGAEEVSLTVIWLSVLLPDMPDRAWNNNRNTQRNTINIQTLKEVVRNILAALHTYIIDLH